MDTPGFFKTQPSRLVHNLHHKVRDALEGIDVIVHVVDPTRSIGPGRLTWSTTSLTMSRNPEFFA